eukprot:m.45297 g.45297  ORF g.45297 m.45297 type:complete len:267 (-) comp19935_c0_seq1:282-1082(-)
MIRASVSKVQHNMEKIGQIKLNDEDSDTNKPAAFNPTVTIDDEDDGIEVDMETQVLRGIQQMNIRSAASRKNTHTDVDDLEPSNDTHLYNNLPKKSTDDTVFEDDGLFPKMGERYGVNLKPNERQSFEMISKENDVDALLGMIEKAHSLPRRGRLSHAPLLEYFGTEESLQDQEETSDELREQEQLQVGRAPVVPELSAQYTDFDVTGKKTGAANAVHQWIRETPEVVEKWGPESKSSATWSFRVDNFALRRLATDADAQQQRAAE